MTETNTLRNFLLDDLDEDRRQAVEELMFSDDDVFQRLCVLDDDLVESYIRGELSTADSQRLFRRLNASERGRRTLDLMVEIADRAKAGTQSHAAEASAASAPAATEVAPSPRIASTEAAGRGFFDELRGFFASFTAAPRAALVMCSLLVAAVALPWWQMERMNHRLETLGADNAALTDQIASLEQRPDAGLAPVQATFSLRPLVRAEGAQEPKLWVAPETETLELWLDPGGLVTYAEFRVRLRAQSEDLWHVEGLGSQQSPDRGFFVPVRIPADVVEPGRYDVILDGLAEDRYREVARYPIDVDRRP